ncbi:MAG: hypothetical protein J6J36_07115 [Clostridia bacterium]|nr:hypothetical protein [Clostridia bacterium]
MEQIIKSIATVTKQSLYVEMPAGNVRVKMTPELESLLLVLAFRESRVEQPKEKIQSEKLKKSRSYVRKRRAERT